ncbi:NYN domain-containing protein, partial [Streptomyces calidiresistens]|uniref:NYN domain-containing protein n=1 Tax=Streptomyces calidiresistens TaxID=1485586 RepID=UPI002B21A7B8
MDRCVVLVDAGYLLGAAASLVAGEPSRSRITVDHAALIRGLRERARAETGCELLRIYWFDGAPDRVPQPEHRRLRVMPRVTVRLGALTRSDGRWAQKGVDAAMHAELTELARNRACADIVLVTGDGDLLPGLMSAKEHGVAVHLWAVQAADGDYNQSEDLVAEADERRVLDREWITRSVGVRDALPLTHGREPTRPEIAAILSAPLPEPGGAGDHRSDGAEPSRNGSGPRPVPPCPLPPGGAAHRDGVLHGDVLHGDGAGHRGNGVVHRDGVAREGVGRD